MHLCISVCTPAGLRALTRTQCGPLGVLLRAILAESFRAYVFGSVIPVLNPPVDVLCNPLHRSRISPEPPARDNECTEAFDKL